MKISIYIATQAKHDFPKSDNYIPLLVGKPDEKFEGAVNDSTGDSISEKNRFYCELTGHYWIWKNDNISDIVGLCHYRRFLWLNEIPRRLRRKIFDSFSEKVDHYLKAESVQTILNEQDIILPRPYAFSSGDIREHFVECHGQQGFELMADSVQRLFPDYMKSLNLVFSRRYEYIGNLLITRKKIFDEYSDWLFKILQDVESKIDLGDEKNLRLLGYLGERLLNLYVVHNNLRIKEVPQIFIIGQKNSGEQDLYVDFRYIKRRYLSSVLDIEESIRNRLKS